MLWAPPALGDACPMGDRAGIQPPPRHGGGHGGGGNFLTQAQLHLIISQPERGLGAWDAAGGQAETQGTCMGRADGVKPRGIWGR